MENSFEVLNKILEGEHMAVEQYQIYINSLPDSPLRNHLIAMLTDHKNHATRLAYFIQTNGGLAVEGTGLNGLMARISTRVKNIGENKPLEMLEELYDGEDKGLARAVQLSDQYLSDSEKDMLGIIFADEHEHLKQLLRLKEDLLM